MRAHMHHRFGIVAIHMEDRRLHHQRDVGAIGRGARIDRRGGEADLVVDDEMDGAAGAEALGARHGETFRHHALAGERGIAVDQQRQHAERARRCRRSCYCLARALPSTTGSDDFQMRRVGGQRQMHLVAVEFAVGRGAQMVFHVARALTSVGLALPPWNSWNSWR